MYAYGLAHECYIIIILHCNRHLNLSSLLIQVSLHFQYLSTIYVFGCVWYLCLWKAQIDAAPELVLMNPPWGQQRRSADRPFLEAGTCSPQP